MNTRHCLAALLVAGLLTLGGRALADAPSIAVEAPSTRVARPMSVSTGLTAGAVGLPMFGIEFEYQVTERFAFGAELSTALFVGGASANVRYFLAAQPSSGLFLELAGRTYGGLATATGGSADLGYQYRSPGGFLFELSGGVWVMDEDSCGCGPPPSLAHQSPWHTSAEGSFRVGLAF